LNGSGPSRRVVSASSKHRSGPIAQNEPLCPGKKMSTEANENILSDPKRVYDQVVDLIVSEGMVDREKITPDATFESLGLKSIDLVMILTAVEEKFDVYIPMDGSIAEAKDLKSFIDGVLQRITSEKTG
jgi:acyl carrier protein